MKATPVFKKANQVVEIVENLLEADEDRAYNRSLIDRLFNGDPPYTDQEADENNIETNVNFLEGAIIVHKARQQWQNAFFKPTNHFSVQVDLKDPHQAMRAGAFHTRTINRIMKKRLAWFEFLRSQGANAIVHGVSPSAWSRKSNVWIPEALAPADVLVPNKTTLAMQNLQHFAIRREWTSGELFDLAIRPGRRVHPGWNQSLVKKILGKLVESGEKGEEQDNMRMWDEPEKLADLEKDNAFYWNSDALPTVKAWDFYYRRAGDKQDSWQRSVVLDPEHPLYKDNRDREFLFRWDSPYANNWNEIAHWQFGDVANKAPFRYHQVRSLGFILYSICHLQNRLRCKFSDSVFENLMWYFRGTEADIDRIQRIDLHHLGIIPEGIGIVGRQERYEPNEPLVRALLSENRQIMSENAAGFTQDIDAGTKKEMTATEAMSKTTTANALVSAMLGLAFTYEKPMYEQICQRFIRGGSNTDLKEFHRLFKEEGLPKEALDFERWSVQVESPLGAGNKQLELYEAKELMGVRPLMDPDQQRVVLNRFVLSVSDDSRLADQLVPLDKKVMPSDSIIEAQQTAAALLAGLPVGMVAGVNRGEFVAALIQTLGWKVKQIEQRGAMVRDGEELQGLKMLADYTQKNIQLMQEDQTAAGQVRQFTKALGELQNYIKAYEQRLQEAMQKQQQAQGGIPPEKAQQLQFAAASNQQKAQERQSSHLQKYLQRQQAFAGEQQRKEQAAQEDLRRTREKFNLEQRLKDADKGAEIIRNNEQPQSPS